MVCKCALQFSSMRKKNTILHYAQLFDPGMPGHTYVRGTRLCLRVNLCICILSHRGRFLSSNSFPEEQCLIYWSPSNTMLIWGSEGQAILQCQKMPFQKIGEMERAQYEGQVLPLMHPMDGGRGGQLPLLSPPV